MEFVPDPARELIHPDPRGLDLPRYESQPIYLFFEDLILAVLGFLGVADYERLERMELWRVFGLERSSWSAAVRAQLNLSETIDIAIRDLWIRQSEAQARQGRQYHPLAFAQDFVDQFYAEGSEVDVWPPGALERAGARIRRLEAGGDVLE